MCWVWGACRNGQRRSRVDEAPAAAMRWRLRRGGAAVHSLAHYKAVPLLTPSLRCNGSLRIRLPGLAGQSLARAQP